MLINLIAPSYEKSLGPLYGITLVYRGKLFLNAIYPRSFPLPASLIQLENSSPYPFHSRFPDLTIVSADFFSTTAQNLAYFLLKIQFFFWGHHTLLCELYYKMYTQF